MSEYRKEICLIHYKGDITFGSRLHTCMGKYNDYELFRKELIKYKIPFTGFMEDETKEVEQYLKVPFIENSFGL